MESYSTTQATNLAAFASLIVLVLGHFKVAIAQEEVITLIAGIVGVVAVVKNWILRYKKGDLTVLGSRK